MRTKTISLHGTEYKINSLTRGQVRSILDLESEQEMSDELVRLSLDIDDIDDIDMVVYTDLVQAIVQYNGLSKDSVASSKKN